MVMEKVLEDRSLTSTINIDKNKRLISSRRNFIAWATLIPLCSLILSKEANAFWPLIVRLFAHSVGRRLFTRGLARSATQTPSRVRRPNTSIVNSRSNETKFRVTDALEIAGNVYNASDELNLAEFVEKTVWETNSSNNPASIVIDNENSSNNMNTGNINIKLRDVASKKVEFTANVDSMIIPPKTRLVIDMKFSNIPSAGIKRIHGDYGDNKHNAQESGYILVLDNARKKLKGRTVDDLYDEFEKNKLKSKYILG
jgi:hypothetical protein